MGGIDVVLEGKKLRARQDDMQKRVHFHFIFLKNNTLLNLNLKTILDLHKMV